MQTKKLKTYQTPIAWEINGYANIEGSSLEDVLEKVEREDMPIPIMDSFLEQSFRLTTNDKKEIATHNECLEKAAEQPF